jgi:hypothetical protein
MQVTYVYVLEMRHQACPLMARESTRAERLESSEAGIDVATRHCQVTHTLPPLVTARQCRSATLNGRVASRSDLLDTPCRHVTPRWHQ